MDVLAQFGRRVQQAVVRPLRGGELPTGEGEVVDDRAGSRLRAAASFGIEIRLRIFERQGPRPVSVASRTERHGAGVGVRIARVWRGLPRVVSLSHDPRPGVVFHAVLDTGHVAGEPPVHAFQRRRAPVPALVIEDLERHAPLPQRRRDAVAVLGHDVPVVEGVAHERGGAHAVDVVQVVPAGPEVVVIAGHSVQLRRHLIAHVGEAVVADLGEAAEDEVEQDVDVLARVSARRPHQSVGSVVVVVGCVRRDRNDRLEALDPGRRGGQG